jgi:hypothetical protein
MDELKESGFAIIDTEAVEKLLSAKPEGTEVEMHRTAAGALDKFASFDVMGVPLGGATIGVGTVSLIDWAVARFAPKQAAFLTGTAGKLVLALVAKRFLSKPLGSKTTDAMAFVLTISAVESYVNQLIGKLTGVVTMQQVKPAGSVATSADRMTVDQYLKAQGLI